MKVVAISIFAMTILLLGVVRGDIGFFEYQSLARAQELLERTNGELSKEIRGLRLEVKRLETSSAYARKVLRDKYHLTDDHEQIVFFSD